jgi:hydroxymethylbilane synthase
MATRTHWRLGTRGSGLALVQSRGIASALQQHHPGVTIELVVIKTQGDLNQRDPLSQIGGKGVFVREIEQELLAGSIDFAVHSLKDLPSQLPEGLTLAPPPPRADPRDALVGPSPLLALADGLRVGTGSVRRQAQLRRLRPDLEFSEIRGNVPTRIEKWRRGDYPGGVVLACAGLQRLGSESGASDEEIHPLDTEQCLPAPCQGILGLEYRSQDQQTRELLACLSDPTTQLAFLAERAFLRALGGDCNLPAGGLACLRGDSLSLRANLWKDRLLEVEVQGPPEDAEAMGLLAARRLMQE